MSGKMKKIAFLFPGQASQYVGMAKDIADEFFSVDEMFEIASNILGYELDEVCYEGPEDKLKQTIYTQPAVFVHSCAVDMLLKENYIVASAAAGHSLGEYSALVSAGALTFEEALKAIARRSAAMQEDCDRTPGTMAAVMGLTFDEVKNGIDGVEGIVVTANYNGKDQIVIAGEKNAVEAACEKLKAAGAKRAILLQVSGAYHSPLMEYSSNLMKEVISDMQFDNFAYPVYANVNAEPLSDIESYRPLLSSQISSPVLWYPTIQNMYRDGIRRFVEVGPGKVLQGLAKRSFDDPEVEIFGVDTLDDLDKFIEQFPREK